MEKKIGKKEIMKKKKKRINERLKLKKKMRNWKMGEEK